MRKMMKLFALMMVLVLGMSLLSACGSDDKSKDPGKDDAKKTADVKGEEQSWGNITVLVPEGMQFKGGSTIDEKDENSLTISGDGMANYFMISIQDDEEQAKSNISTTKDINSGEDLDAFKVGDTEWKGIKYESMDIACFMIYGTVNGKIVQVGSAGYKIDDDTVTGVLESLKVK